MAISVSYNGVTYSIPEYQDENWGPEVTSYLNALSTGSLTLTGGLFTLQNEVNFGGTYGLKSAYFSTRTANPALTGLVRLANTESLKWRNSFNTADLALTVGADNVLYFNNIPLTSNPAAVGQYQYIVSTGGTVFNTTVSTIASTSTTAYQSVYVNGIKQVYTTDYAVTGANQITFTNTIPALDEVVIFGWNTTDINGLSFQQFTATASQTVFNTTIGTNTSTQVFVNGVTNYDYTVTGANQITFNTGLILGDIVEIQLQASEDELITAFASQTVFLTAYEVQTNAAGFINTAIYVNGVLQIEDAGQYTITGPYEITFGTGLNAGDEVLIRSFGTSTANTAPGYEIVTSSLNQTVFNTVVDTLPNTSQTFLMVFVNGVKQREGALRGYLVTGANQVTFNSPLPAGDDVEFVSFA